MSRYVNPLGSFVEALEPRIVPAGIGETALRYPVPAETRAPINNIPNTGLASRAIDAARGVVDAQIRLYRQQIIEGSGSHLQDLAASQRLGQMANFRGDLAALNQVVSAVDRARLGVDVVNAQSRQQFQDAFNAYVRHEVGNEGARLAGSAASRIAIRSEVAETEEGGPVVGFVGLYVNGIATVAGAAGGQYIAEQVYDRVAASSVKELAGAIYDKAHPPPAVHHTHPDESHHSHHHGFFHNLFHAVGKVIHDVGKAIGTAAKVVTHTAAKILPYAFALTGLGQSGGRRAEAGRPPSG